MQLKVGEQKYPTEGTLNSRSVPYPTQKLCFHSTSKQKNSVNVQKLDCCKHKINTKHEVTEELFSYCPSQDTGRTQGFLRELKLVNKSQMSCYARDSSEMSLNTCLITYH
jgi:hypothetical protein